MGKNKNYNYHAEEEIIEELEIFEAEDIVEEAPKVEKDYVPSIEPGYISGCGQLNLRFEPDPEAPVMNVLKRDQMVMVYLDEDYGDWYRVRTEYGVGGFVMKKYVEVG